MSVRIEPPLADVERALKESPERLEEGTRARFAQIAEQVAGAARTRATGGRPAKAKKVNTGGQHWRDLVASIKGGTTDGNPHVSIGREGVSWALGFEFGSRGGPRKRQFPPFRENGYFLGPAVAAAAEGVDQQMARVADETFGDVLSS